MKLLLDTHIFIRWANEPQRLSQTALNALSDPNNDLILSVASVWEMQIKIQLGKMKLNRSLQALISSQQNTNGIQILSATLDHILALDTLPFHHKDPFDRLLMAQSIIESLTIVSADTKLAAYQINLIS